jgi:hypothetical protein
MTIYIFLVDVTMMDLLKNKNMKMMMIRVSRSNFIFFFLDTDVAREIYIVPHTKRLQGTQIYMGTVFHSNTTT